MSGMYFVRSERQGDPVACARLLSAQLAQGGEAVNHYAVSGPALMGLTTRDKLNQGVMPRYLPQTRLWGVMEGELHECDFLEAFRKARPDVTTDIETIASLWRADELVQALPFLNGAFFFFLWDEEADTLVAGNDRYGLYPMYWAQTDGVFCLGSRVAHSVLANASNGAWNTAGLAQLFTTDDYWGETTLVAGVEAFPQATVLTLRSGKPLWKRHWRYDYAPRLAGTPLAEIGKRLGEGLVRAVRRQAKTGRRIGITLSGGLDSRCLVAAASRLGTSLHTFTWTKPGAYDGRFARDVAALYGTEHHGFDYAYLQFASHCEECARVVEGLNNYFDCHMAAHAHLVAPHADVTLNGYAAGVLLGGSYLRSRWMREMPTDALADLLFAWRNTGLREDELSEALSHYEELEGGLRPRALYARLIAETDAPSTPDRVDRFYLESRQRRVTAMGAVLLRTDVESAAGFFDYDLLDLITGIPASLRKEHRAYLAMMRTTFPEALRIRCQRTLLPAGAPGWAGIGAKAFLKGCRLLDRRLGWPRITRYQSPVDFAVWLRGPLKTWMDALVHTPNAATQEALHARFCRKIWAEHLAGRDRTQLLGAIAAVAAFGQVLDRARRKLPAANAFPVRISAK